MENINSVVYIGQINNIHNIDGADFIQLAQVDGWSGVIKKDQFKVGDLVAVFTNDAVLPTELSERIGVTQYLRNGERVRTVRLKGVYSECLLVDVWQLHGKGDVFPVKKGKCLQEYLKVFKYEPPVTQVIGADGKKYNLKENPKFERYQKFPNAKNVSKMFDEFDFVSITRKIHGTNFRAGILLKPKTSILDRIKRLFGNRWAGYEFVLGSHNTQRSEQVNSDYSFAAKKYDVKRKLWMYLKTRLNPKDIGCGITVYGEVYGPGIQGEYYTYGKTERELALFDITINNRYLNRFEFEILVGILDIPTVPELSVGLFDADKVARLTGGYIDGTKIPNEGVVVKDVYGNRQKVAKFINNEYLTFGEKNSVPDAH